MDNGMKLNNVGTREKIMNFKHNNFGRVNEAEYDKWAL